MTVTASTTSRDRTQIEQPGLLMCICYGIREGSATEGEKNESSKNMAYVLYVLVGKKCYDALILSLIHI